MEVEFISSEAKAAHFLPGEIGEVVVRVLNSPSGIKVACVPYLLGVLTESDKSILIGLCSYLRDKLEAANYKVSKRPDGQ